MIPFFLKHPFDALFARLYRREIALHEIGHVAMYTYLGGLPEGVYVTIDGNKCGATRQGYITSIDVKTDHPHAIERWLTWAQHLLLGGLAVEELFSLDIDSKDTEGGDYDIWMQLRTAMRFNNMVLDPDEEAYTAQMRAITMFLTHNAYLVVEMGKALEAQKTMDRAALLPYMQRFRPVTRISFVDPQCPFFTSTPLVLPEGITLTEAV